MKNQKKFLIKEINNVPCIILNESIFDITSSNCIKIKCTIENEKCTTFALKNIDGAPIIVIPTSIVKKRGLKKNQEINLILNPIKCNAMTLPKDLLEAFNKIKAFDISKVSEFELKQFIVILNESKNHHIRRERLDNIIKSLQAIKLY